MKKPSPCATCDTDLSQAKESIEYDLPAKELRPELLVRVQVCAKCHEERCEKEPQQELEL